MENNKPKITVDLSFEKIDLPPFKDILILTKKCPHGINGIKECMNFLIPEGFDIEMLKNEDVEAIIINRDILKRMSIEQIIKLLEEKIFPYINPREMVRVDLKIKLSFDSIEID